ncbi:MAG: DNA helicase, partial [Comamonadaceae bacterium]
PQGPFAQALAPLVDALRTYRDRASAWLALAGAEQGQGPSLTSPGQATATASLDLRPAALLDCAQAVSAHRHQLKAWCDWRRAEKDAQGLGLSPLTQAVLEPPRAGQAPAARAQHAFEIGYARWFAAMAMDADPLLRNFVSAEHASDIARYRELLDTVAALSVRYTRARLCADIPPKNDVAKRSGYGVLKHELQKSRRHKPIRQLALEMGDALHQLAPCMLMSPLSIAQFLPPGQALFDLVIFDEASQIAPWDAIGSIARGKQVVIAGDPRQMPPTSFFNRAASAEDDDTEEDMESILDQCLATGVVSRSLDWHYRSRHESLIAFSNHRYYDSALITFPAAVTRQSAVQWRRVPGVYAKGQGRNNVIEAQAMVDETVARLTDPAFVAAGHSIGIITLNSEQQTLVADLLDQARQAHPEIEVFFQDDRREPVVVKNLETVQGDERDVILLGIGYGPTAANEQTMSMNFGPLNKEGGWRRLNVAITRARREMLVFSSFDPIMIDLNRTSARAVRDLKQFIAYAQHGPGVLADTTRTDSLTYGSMFEEAVARGLREKGWTVVPQVGVSRFRVNLGVVHPDQPHVYLAGIECDGPSYRDAATARDRDQVRAAVLEGLGWQLLRVWSSDWWVDPAGALDRLHDQITGLLARN